MKSIKKSKTIPTWLSYCIVFTILLLCTLLSSFVAIRIVKNRFVEAQVDTTLESVNTELYKISNSINQSVNSTLLMNTYAMDNKQYTDKKIGQELRNYTIYSMMRYSKSMCPYTQNIVLVDSSSALLYDSDGTILSQEIYADKEILTLINECRDYGYPPLDKLNSTYREIQYPSNALQWQCMTIILTRKDGWNLIININLNRVWKSCNDNLTSCEQIKVEPFLLYNNEYVISASQGQNKDIPTVEQINKLSFDANGNSNWTDEKNQRWYITAYHDTEYNLSYYALFKETAILENSTTELRRLQTTQLILFSFCMFVFAGLSILLMRPIAKLLRDTLYGRMSLKEKKSIFAINEMLETVVQQNESLILLEKNTRPVHIANLLNGLLTDREEDITRCFFSLAQYNIHFDETPTAIWQCAVIAFSVDSLNNDTLKSRQRYLVKKLEFVLTKKYKEPADNTLKERFVVCIRDDVIVIAMHIHTDNELFYLMQEIYLDMIACLDPNITITIGTCVGGIHQLRDSYESAAAAIMYRISFDKGEIINTKQLEIKKGIFETYWQSVGEELIQSIWSGNVEKAEGCVSAIFTFIHQNQYNIWSREITDIIITLCRTVLDAYKEVRTENTNIGIAAQECQIYEMIQQISTSTFLKLKKFCSEIVVDVTCLFSSSKEITITTHSRHQLTVQRICAYVDAHYSEDIQLGVIADEIGYNASYLGSMFHENVNMSFSQYLENKRLVEAAYHLKTRDWKVSKIAELVGYHSVTYFSTAFRKKYGTSPEKYRGLWKIEGKSEI